MLKTIDSWFRRAFSRELFKKKKKQTIICISHIRCHLLLNNFSSQLVLHLEKIFQIFLGKKYCITWVDVYLDRGEQDISLDLTALMREKWGGATCWYIISRGVNVVAVRAGCHPAGAHQTASPFNLRFDAHVQPRHEFNIRNNIRTCFRYQRLLRWCVPRPAFTMKNGREARWERGEGQGGSCLQPQLLEIEYHRCPALVFSSRKKVDVRRSWG